MRLLSLDPLTLKRTGRSNDCLVAPRGAARAKIDRHPPTFEVPAAALFRAWRRLILDQPRARLVAEDEGRRLLVAEQRSLVFRFVDTIAVRALDAPGGGATFAAYSRSNLGAYDFGVNRARLERWTAALQARLGS